MASIYHLRSARVAVTDSRAEDGFQQAPSNHRHFSISAPGNLLLMGEYAITEENGTGLCLAPEVRAFLVCRPVVAPAASLRLRGVWPRGGFEWTGTLSANGAVDCPALLAAVLAEYDELAQVAREGNPVPDAASVLGGLEIEIDTSAFFHADGRKIGLGSSACSCLLLSAALLRLAGLQDMLPTFAVRAHRRFQGGKGSGYDVLCSFSGGLSVFTGGKEPRILRLGSFFEKHFSSFCIFPGPAAVHSGSSVAGWKTWEATAPDAAQRYVDECGRRVDDLVATLHHSDHQHAEITLRRVLEEARRAGIELGEALGISARLDPLDTPREAGTPGESETTRGTTLLISKAVGAGNETGFGLGKREELEKAFPGQPVLTHSDDGLRIHDIFAETTGQGKLLLFGEHAALYGWPALGIPLRDRTEIRFCGAGTAAPGDLHTTIFSRLGPDWSDAAGKLLHLGISAIPELVVPQGYFEISGTVPSAGGFGSSAAACVALARMLIQLARNQNIRLPDGSADELVWRFSTWLDSYFHGSASGIDTGLAQAAGLTLFRPAPTDSPAAHLIGTHNQTSPFARLRLVREGLTPPPNAPDLWLVSAALRRSGNTKTLVGAIRQRMEDRDPETVYAMERLGQCAEAAIEYCRRGADSAIIGELALQAHGLLSILGLAAKEQDILLEAGRKAGADGGKLSGAGSGGAFWLVCASQQKAHHVLEVLSKTASDKAIHLVVPPTCLRIGPELPLKKSSET